MLKAVLTDINTVDESVRPFYAEKDGKFYLKVEPVTDGDAHFALENVSNLKKALEAERKNVDVLKGTLKSFEGLDPTVARTAITRVTEFGDIDPAKAREGLTALDKFSKFNPETEAEKLAEEKLKNAKAQIKADFLAEKTSLEGQLNELKEKLAKREAQITKNLKKNTIQAELNKLNPLDDARDALEIMAENAVQLQEINGEYVPVVVDASGAPRTKFAADYSSIPFTVADLMAEMREKRAALFKADPKLGMGTEKTRVPAGEGEGGKGPAGNVPGFDFPNPFDPKAPNLTRQMFLMRKNPDLAARLKAEAGL